MYSTLGDQPDGHSSSGRLEDQISLLTHGAPNVLHRGNRIYNYN